MIFFGAHDPRVHFSHPCVHVKDPLSVEVEVAGRAKFSVKRTHYLTLRFGEFPQALFGF